MRGVASNIAAMHYLLPHPQYPRLTMPSRQKPPRQDPMAPRSPKASSDAQQERLAERVRAGELRHVFLDPDGTWSEWLAVVIEHPTGIAYSQQCGGTANDHRLVEGYLVPLGGPQCDAEAGSIEVPQLRDVFHRGTGCVYKWVGFDLPSDRRERLAALVATVPYWQCRLDGGPDARLPLALDHSRIDEICEAWVPVVTPDGPGILVYANCD